MHLRNHILYSIIGLTFICGLILSSTAVYADDSVVDVIDITVPSSCTFAVGGGGTYNTTIDNGDSDVVTANNLTVSCNDISGYAIYAIGYSGDSYYGNNTDLIHESDTSYNIKTDGTGTYGSSWKMKLTAVSNATIEGNYGTAYQNIPSTYVKVASFSTNTTAGVITPQYQINISNTQMAGTYTGKVKYTVVHPSSAAAPMMPLDPSLAPQNSIVYAPNADDIIGSMDSISNTKITSSPTAGVQSASANSTATLIAPNYAREGYGFAGWSTDFEATSSSKIYGPNETVSTNPNDEGGLNVSNSNHGAILYPVWIAKETNVTMQTFNSTNYPNYSSAPNGTVIALEDERDHDVYAVAKLADGKWWMIENLRLDDTATITTTNTHNPLTSNNSVALKIDYDNNTTANHLAASSNTWCTTSSTACDDQTMLNTNNTNRTLDPSYNGTGSSTYYQWYGYGNYYNWYSATAGNGTYSKSSGDVDGDLCPTGWHLPYGNSSGTGNTAGGFYYLNTLMSNDTSTQGSKDWRKFPNNFVYSGDFNDASANNRGSNGLYWSRSARSSGSAYSLYLSSSFVYPGTDGSLKNYGRAVRCIAQ